MNCTWKCIFISARCSAISTLPSCPVKACHRIFITTWQTYIVSFTCWTASQYISITRFCMDFCKCSFFLLCTVSASVSFLHSISANQSALAHFCTLLHKTYTVLTQTVTTCVSFWPVRLFLQLFLQIISARRTAQDTAQDTARCSASANPSASLPFLFLQMVSASAHFSAQRSAFVPILQMVLPIVPKQHFWIVLGFRDSYRLRITSM